MSQRNRILEMAAGPFTALMLGTSMPKGFLSKCPPFQRMRSFHSMGGRIGEAPSVA